MGNTVAISYVNTWGGASHLTDDYYSFLRSPHYWGFLHIFNSFWATYLLLIGLPQRWMSYILAGLEVMFCGTIWSIFQEMSVPAPAVGHVSLLNNMWQAGDQTWDLFYNLIGVLFMWAFMWAVNPLPVQLLYPQPSTGKGKVLGFKQGYPMPWLLFILNHVLLPFGLVVGSLLMFHILGAPDNKKGFRLDFLIYIAYQLVCVLGVFLIRRIFLVKTILYTARRINAKSDKPEKIESGDEYDPMMPQSGCTEEQVKRRMLSEFVCFMAGCVIMDLLMLFRMIDEFYLQPLIAIGAAALVVAVLRIVMGTNIKNFSFYTRKIPELHDWSATNDKAVGSHKHKSKHHKAVGDDDE